MEPLTVSMSGIKLGDRLLVVGTSDTALIAALAVKAGLTGRACIVDEAEGSRARAAAAVEREGALIESFTAPLTALPFEAAAFDVALLRGVLTGGDHARAAAIVAEASRVLRPGGRCIVINGETRGGLAGLLGGSPGRPAGESAAAAAALTAGGFRGVRTLAERDGLSFIEGVKAGTAQAV
jgi:ubiquinone/menaquinone biosynthesis C-methylase UbiE